MGGSGDIHAHLVKTGFGKSDLAHAKTALERSVAAAPNPVTADELATMKKELEQAGADLVVPRATEEEGFQIAVEKA